MHIGGAFLLELSILSTIQFHGLECKLLLLEYFHAHFTQVHICFSDDAYIDLTKTVFEDICKKGKSRNNPSQKEAIERSLCRSFHLIQGPPGK